VLFSYKRAKTRLTASLFRLARIGYSKQERLMNSASPSPGGRDNPAARQPAEPRQKRTPNTDMQAEDAGTPESGNGDDSGSAATRAMKQTSKTAAESGNER
jgi:hypothetical protein